MSQAQIKEAISAGKINCPTCKNPVKSFEKFVETTDSVWDGAGDSNLETKGCKVTLVCGNPGCDWKERTEYWTEFLSD